MNMDKLQIGEVIFKLRKEKGITQDELGSFIGVSTAAVSKWESGLSYPDITLLPVLATFFNITIDELLNFKIELSDEEVMKIYTACEAIFSKGNLEEAIKKSETYLAKYPNSYYLRFRIGFLFNIYSWKSADEEMCRKMLAFAAEQYEVVAQNCSKLELVEQALYSLGAVYPALDEQDKAIEALSKIHKSQLNPNILLASIYIENKNLKKAREILQGNLYKSLNDLSFACMGLANSYDGHLDMVEKYYNLIINIKKCFYDGGTPVLSLYSEYLSLAEAYLKTNKTSEALAMLSKMFKEVTNRDINKPINFSQTWCFNEISQGQRTLTMDMYENMLKILEQPCFDLIRDNYEFNSIIKDLKELERGSTIN
jgi:transcriptional regulator with XRE-family HTH domain